MLIQFALNNCIKILAWKIINKVMWQVSHGWRLWLWWGMLMRNKLICGWSASWICVCIQASCIRQWGLLYHCQFYFFDFSWNLSYLGLGWGGPGTLLWQRALPFLAVTARKIGGHIYDGGQKSTTGLCSIEAKSFGFRISCVLTVKAVSELSLKLFQTCPYHISWQSELWVSSGWSLSVLLESPIECGWGIVYTSTVEQAWFQRQILYIYIWQSKPWVGFGWSVSLPER